MEKEKSKREVKFLRERRMFVEGKRGKEMMTRNKKESVETKVKRLLDSRIYSEQEGREMQFFISQYKRKRK